MVFMDGQKMSKSLGNLVFVDELRKEWDPRAIRLAIIEQPLPPRLGVERRADAAQHRAAASVEGRVGRRHGPTALLDDVRAALDDDLDTPGALAAIDAAAAAGHDVASAAALLGVDL